MTTDCTSRTAPVPTALVVTAAGPAYAERAAHLAERLGAPLHVEGEGTDGATAAAAAGGPASTPGAANAAAPEAAPAAIPDLALRVDADGLTLAGDGMELRGDFTRLLPRLKDGRLQRELLVRAARLKGFTGTPVIVDATAGLGEDSLLLAAAGFSVELYESDPVIAALLEDALARAVQDPALTAIAARMHLHIGDSIACLTSTNKPAPDVVYLDPMFPERRKSAAVKKKFQLLHKLERPCANEEALVQAALAAHPRKVVIKRPPKGPFLAGIKPAYSLTGKAVRFDCLVLP